MDESISKAVHQRQLSLNQRSTASRDAEEFVHRQGVTWQDSSLFSRCVSCNCKFTLTNRKHHCRECGHVFCSKCSSYKIVVEGRLKRACEKCYLQAIGSTNKPLSKPDTPIFYSNVNLSQVPTSSGVFNPSGEDVSVLPAEQYPPWVEAFAFRRVELRNGHVLSTLQTVSPEKNRLSEEMQQDIFSNALMSLPLSNTSFQRQRFFFRIRDKTAPGFLFRDEGDEVVGTAVTKATEFFNCYCLLTQAVILPADASQNSPTNRPKDHHLVRQVFVLVSRWPFPFLAYSIISKMEEALHWQANRSSAEIENELVDQEDSDDGNLSTWREYYDIPGPEATSRQSVLGSTLMSMSLTKSTVDDVFLVAIAQISSWPLGRSGAVCYLIFFGEVLSFHVPTDLLSSSLVNLSMGTTLSTMNLLSVLAPLGLLQHVWLLWELVVTGRDILIVAPVPGMCCDVALAIASLIAPHYHVGDLRPVLTSEDSDSTVIAATTQLKLSSVSDTSTADSVSKVLARKKAMIIGSTDPRLLSTLSEFQAAVFLSHPSATAFTTLTESDSAYMGLRSKNMADLASIDEAKNETLLMQFGKWMEKPSAQRRNMIVLNRTTLAASGNMSLQNESPVFSRIFRRIKAMQPDERMVLGDKLLRDNLRQLTQAFFAPTKPSGPDRGYSIQSVNEDHSGKEGEQAEVARVQSMRSEAERIESRGMFDAGLSELRSLFARSPEWFRRNVILVLFYVLLILAVGVLLWLGLPFFVVVSSLIFVRLPDKAPVQFDQAVRHILPDSVLTPAELEVQSKAVAQTINSKADSSAPSAQATASVSRGQSKRQNLSGIWKRIRAENYEEFIRAQGGGFVQRKLAASMALVHTITMNDDLTTFRLQEKGGPIDSDVQYSIDGPEILTVFLSHQFLDKVFWSKDNVLTMRKLHMPAQDYVIVGRRWLESDGQILRAEITFQDLKTNKTVEACNVFQLVGPSPNASVSAPVSRQSPLLNLRKSIDVVQQRVPMISKPNFSGVWKRIRTHNYDAFAGAGGAGFLQRKLAATMPMTHTLTLNEPQSTVCRLQEEGGPVLTDCVLTIGDPQFSPVSINGKTLLQRMFWLDKILVLQRRFTDNDEEELIFTRELDPESPPDSPQILLKAVHKNIRTKKETVGLAWFLKIGPSPNPIPQPDPAAIHRIDQQRSNSTGTGSAEKSSRIATANAEENEDLDHDEDDDDDDDETALARMHNRTLTKQQDFVSRLTRASMPINMSPKFSPQAFPSSSLDIATRAHLQQLAQVQPFSGLWTLNNTRQQQSDEPNKLLQSLIAAPIHRVIADVSDSGDVIVKILELSTKSKLLREASYILDGDFVLRVRDDDQIVVKSRIFLESKQPEDRKLIVYEACAAEEKEYIFQRELFNGGKSMRLIVTVRNLKSGKEENTFTLQFVKSN